jgi:hypothetical protein
MITFIGTHHLDLKGYTRLSKLLLRLHPEHVGIEYSSSIIQSVLEKESLVHSPISSSLYRMLQEKMPLVDASLLVSLVRCVGYEYLVAEKYCTLYGAQLHLCESNGGEILEMVDIFPVNKDTATYQQEVDKAYLEESSVSEVQEMRERDAYAESILCTLEGKIAYVGGMDHFFMDYHNLYRRFPQSHRLRLIEADDL